MKEQDCLRGLLRDDSTPDLPAALSISIIENAILFKLE